MKSDLFRLNLKDFLKSLLMVVLTALVGGIYQLLETGVLLEWANIKPVLIASALAGLSYLLKNFLTNADDELLLPKK